MIEEIKKEIEPLIVLDDVLYCKYCGSRNIKKSYKPYKIGESIMKILDKYKNQETFLNERIDTLKDTQLKQLNKISELEKYKNAWEELKNKLEKIIATTESIQVHDYVNYVYADMQELEQKHNLDKAIIYE